MERFVRTMQNLNITITQEEYQREEARITAEITGDHSALMASGAAEPRSWEEVEALFQEAPETISVVDDYQKLDNKKLLINVPFFINRWWFTDSDRLDPETGEPLQFAVAQIVARQEVLTEAGPSKLLVISDGSTGICRQLREITKATGKTTRLAVRHGLRVSQYSIEIEGGSQDAETFYLT
jgi:hypothetical protein